MAKPFGAGTTGSQKYHPSPDKATPLPRAVEQPPGAQLGIAIPKPQQNRGHDASWCKHRPPIVGAPPALGRGATRGKLFFQICTLVPPAALAIPVERQATGHAANETSAATARALPDRVSPAKPQCALAQRAGKGRRRRAAAEKVHYRDEVGQAGGIIDQPGTVYEHAETHRLIILKTKGSCRQGSACPSERRGIPPLRLRPQMSERMWFVVR